MQLIGLMLALCGCNSDPRAASRKYLRSGDQYFSKGKFKEASLLYRRALQKDAKCAEAWYQLGLANDRLGNFVDARKDFSRAMDLDPANTAAIVKLGDLDLLFYAADQRGNKALLADVKDLAQRLLRRDQKSYHALRFLGEIALIEKKLPAAIEKFEQANQVKPYQKELVLALAQSLETAGQDERAVRLARAMAEHDKSAGAIYDFLYANCLRKRQLDSAEEILRQKIANNPGVGAYGIQLAFHYYMTHREAEMSTVLDGLTAKGSGFADARLQVGDYYARIHKLDQALVQYTVGEKEDRKKWRVYQMKIAETLAAQGKTGEASKVLDTLLHADPKDAEAIGLRATLLLANGGPEEVKKAIGALEPLARKSASVVLHSDLGRAYLMSGALEQACAQFSEALRVDSSHVTARLGLAEAELAKGDSALAAIEASRVLDAEPANAPARLLRVRAWTQIGEHRKARQDLEVLLGMDARSPDTRLELAELDLKERRFPAAEAGFQGLIADGDARALEGAIDTEAEQGKWEQAIQIAQAQVEKAPESARFRTILANLLLRSGDFQRAAQQFQILIGQHPNDEQLYLRMGDAKAQLQDLSGARAAFEKARGLAPADASPDVDLGILYDGAKEFSRARAAYEAALAKQPDNARALNNLAYLEAEQGGDLDRALVYARHARAQRPDDVNVIDTLALIYIKKNLTDEGLRMLREAVKRQPGNAAFRLHLAAAWYQKGDRLMARKELEAARRANPTERERGEIQELSARVG